LRQVYDIAHNMAKVEEHEINGHRIRVCVHRKGSTRAFGPGSSVLPEDLRDIGQPVLIPGSMGTASYVLIGTTEAMQQTFGSTCHGAGRVMSRAKAKKMVRGTELRDQPAENPRNSDLCRIHGRPGGRGSRGLQGRIARG
jgi:tRNA-splicing ligase RtcB